MLKDELYSSEKLLSRGCLPWLISVELIVSRVAIAYDVFRDLRLRIGKEERM
jgi:hypothetical protein